MKQTEDKGTATGGEQVDKEAYVLWLFISGASPNSTRAIVNLKEICEKYLPGSYSLEVIDVYKQPTLAKDEELVALPMLIRKAPLPARKLIGDLSDTLKVLKTLGINA